MENNNKLFVIPVDMENRDPQDIARDAANKIVALMEQMNKSQGKQEHKE